MIPEELENLTFRYMPERFFRAVLKAVFQAHSIAWSDCHAAFSPKEAENVLGYYRRGKLEQYLRDVAARFPQMKATVERAEQSNWNHTEIQSGPVVLTENSVQTPCAPVEKAEFRLTLAESSQLSFWDDPLRRKDAPLYAILLHSRSHWVDRHDRQKWDTCRDPRISHIPLGASTTTFMRSTCSTASLTWCKPRCRSRGMPKLRSDT